MAAESGGEGEGAGEVRSSSIILYKCHLHYDFCIRECVMMKRASVLEMKYHPAMKEVQFRRFADGKEIEIPPESVLRTYMNKKDFVLQHQGNTFFDELTCAFDGETGINMDVITTAADYEEFEGMTDYYHRTGNSSCKIQPKLTGELPDMTETFAAIKHLGEQSTEMLKRHEATFARRKEDSSLGSSVKESVEKYHEILQGNIDNITAKMKELNESQVSLLFTGAYSSGKSTLINAILGYRILPEAIESKTARIFCISSPSDDRVKGIRFECGGQYMDLVWDPRIHRFIMPQVDHPLRDEVWEWLKEIEERQEFEQFYMVLDRLNNEKSVGTTIYVTFPIPLDNDKVRFCIYDTPGTDSDSDKHHSVLKKAMEDQTHSILIFVCPPDRLEGSGNNKILQFLKEIEEQGNTGIDRDRSLFVINQADTKKIRELKELQSAEIVCNGERPFSFKLAEKKLFFISAAVAYSAKAVKNDIAGEEEREIASDTKLAQKGSIYYFPSQLNHAAQSEFATNAIQERCAATLQAAEKSGERADVLHVCSGLYALEDEISRYGEKYAAAVKASSLIGAVDHVFRQLQREADSLNNANEEAIEQVNEEIGELEKVLQDSIGTASEQRQIVLKKLPEDVRIGLGIDRSAVGTWVEGGMDWIKNRLQKDERFFSDKIEYSSKAKKEIYCVVENKANEFQNNFLEACVVELKRQRDDFIRDVQAAIRENGGISEAAKKYIIDIPAPEIVPPKGLDNVMEIYNDAKKEESFLFFFRQENVDQEAFLEKTEKFLAKLSGELTDAFTEKYKQALNHIIEAVKNNFTERLDEYSIRLHALNEDREQMQQYGQELVSAADDIKGYQENLEEIIWREKNK